VESGDFILASILFLVAKIGFNSANVFYDALLPHVAKEEDQDRVSSRGYAMGYLGGGILLAVNVVMIQLLPGTWGPRLSFLSVAIWWVVFSIPIFRRVPEPPVPVTSKEEQRAVLVTTFKRLGATLRDLQRYRELFKYLIAFLIYNDGIGTIIGVAAIYGAELGFGTIELILALLLVQFVGIPFSLVFGSLPSAKEKRRPQFLAFVLFNLAALPLVGVLGMSSLPSSISGAPPEPFAATATAVGEGVLLADAGALVYSGDWQDVVVPGVLLDVGGVVGFLNNPFGGEPQDALYRASATAGDRVDLTYNGQSVKLTYRTGPDHGLWEVYLDGEAYRETPGAEPFRIDAYSPTERYGETVEILVKEAGEHTLSLRVYEAGVISVMPRQNTLALAQIEVLPPIRQSNLGIILGMILALQAAGALFAWLAGKALFSKLAERMNTKRSIVLALVVYSVIAIWGFFLNSTVEFWFLAWMVAMVQGGSQALSRSLYASMSPASKSGEFFGFFGVMEKFASLIGPLMFAMAALIFNNSRPAILSLILLFLLGMYLLSRVNVEEGRRVAHEDDAVLLEGGE
jgi:MFS-type transporter involved in bile tolerance (Atg22 family)